MVLKKLAISIVYKQNQISLAGGQLGRLQIIIVVKITEGGDDGHIDCGGGDVDGADNENAEDHEG